MGLEQPQKQIDTLHHEQSTALLEVSKRRFPDRIGFIPPNAQSIGVAFSSVNRRVRRTGIDGETTNSGPRKSVYYASEIGSIDGINFSATLRCSGRRLMLSVGAILASIDVRRCLCLTRSSSRLVADRSGRGFLCATFLTRNAACNSGHRAPGAPYECFIFAADS